jgi:Metallopeptidase family M81
MLSHTLAPVVHPRRGVKVLAKYVSVHQGAPLGEAAEWKEALIGHALPCGTVTKGAFEQLGAELIEGLK